MSSLLSRVPLRFQIGIIIVLYAVAAILASAVQLGGRNWSEDAAEIADTESGVLTHAVRLQTAILDARRIEQQFWVRVRGFPTVDSHGWHPSCPTDEHGQELGNTDNLRQHAGRSAILHSRQYRADRRVGVHRLDFRRRWIDSTAINVMRSYRMAIGTVKWFNGTKGYGFIAPERGGADVFVHISAVERAGLDGLADGQKISFDEERDPKKGKTSAVNLKLV